MTIDVVNYQVVVEGLQAMPSRVATAAVRAMTRAITSSRTAMTRAIARDTGLRPTDVRNAIRVRRATVARPEAKISTSLARIPLYRFNAQGTYPSRGKGQGVSYHLPGSAGGGRIPNAFIAVMESGHRGVFVRSTSKFMREQKPTWNLAREAIVEKFGPSLGYVFEKHRPLGIQHLVEAFHTNFDHELSRLVPELTRGERFAARGLGFDG